MRLLIVVPDGVGIKNYLYSNFIDYLQMDGNIHIEIATTLSKDEFETYLGPQSKNIPIHEISGYHEGVDKFFRLAIRQARLSFFAKKIGNPSLKKFLGGPAKGIKNRTVTYLSNCISAWYKLGGYKYILYLEKIYSFLLSKRPMKEAASLLKKIKPDAIISTHQRPLENIPVFEMARRMNVFASSVIYSWDNVPKAALYSKGNHYYLWSTHMLNEMRFFYPEIPVGNLTITGTPQFSFYKNPAYQWTRPEFYNHLQINEAKKIVLFSGSDTTTSPYDDELLADAAHVIEQIPLENRPVLVFRRSPADFSDRYNKVLEKYPAIKKLDPLWVNKGNSWKTAIPTRADIKNLVGLVQYTSLLINVGSTMALDGAVLNKPCIYIAYSPDCAPHFNYGQAIHTEPHFKAMQDLDAVKYIYNKKDFAPAINQLLENPGAFCGGKDKYLAVITDNIISEAGSNIVKALKEGVRFHQEKKVVR